MSLQDQTGSYIPQTDAGVRDWVNNFASIIASNPAAVGLTPADSTVISALASDYDAAYQLAVNPVTRTPGNVADKDAVRNQAVETCRIYAQQIKNNLGVTDQQKINLGIHINDTTRTPIPAPVTYPLLAIVSAESGVHMLRYADSSTPASRAKPAGAIQMQLYAAVDDEPTADVDKATFIGTYTKQPIEVVWSPDKAGKTATYFARWATRTGLTGQWSLPVAMQIAFGGPVELQSAA